MRDRYQRECRPYGAEKREGNSPYAQGHPSSYRSGAALDREGIDQLLSALRWYDPHRPTGLPYESRLTEEGVAEDFREMEPKPIVA